MYGKKSHFFFFFLTQVYYAYRLAPGLFHSTVICRLISSVCIHTPEIFFLSVCLVFHNVSVPYFNHSYIVGHSFLYILLLQAILHEIPWVIILIFSYYRVNIIYSIVKWNYLKYLDHISQVQHYLLLRIKEPDLGVQKYVIFILHAEVRVP